MTAQTRNSPSRSSFSAAWVEKGTIINVDMRSWVVDVVSEYTSKVITNVHMMYPYLHTANGEGISHVPEVGAIVLVCFPSDNDPPFVLGYVGSFEAEYAKRSDLSEWEERAKVETDELDSPTTTVTAGNTAHNVITSARSGRPLLNPGDLYLSTRDRNFIALRRGGTIQIGATSICQTVFLPVQNIIRTFCQNHEVCTPGGLLYWSVAQQETDPGGLAPVLYRLTLRDKAQQEKATVQVRWGHVDDAIRYQLDIAPEGITVASGAVVGSVFRLTVTETGTQSFDMSGDLLYVIKGQRSVTISGEDTLKVTGSRTVEVQDLKETIKGSQTIDIAQSSTVVCGGVQKVDASLHQFGPGPYTPAVLGEALVQWLVTHSHAAPNAPASQGAALPLILSRKFFIPK